MDSIEEFRRPGEWGFRAHLDMALPCPLSTCTWTLGNDDGGVEIVSGAPMEPGTIGREYAKAVDAAVLEHLRTHSLIEWVQEVTMLRTQLEDATSQDAPAEWRARIEATLLSIQSRLNEIPPARP